MTPTSRIAVVTLGMSLSVFFIFTYLLCLIFGLLVPTAGIHQMLSQLLPGFTWITWPGLLIGLVWAFAFGWFIAIVFAPIHNFFDARGLK